MVTGVCGPTMTANVIGAPISHPPKETPAKSDRRVSILIFLKKKEILTPSSFKRYEQITICGVLLKPLVIAIFV